MSAEPRLLVRQVRSDNGRPWQQRLVLRGLGLRGCGTQVTLLNQRAIRGMIRKVLHLVEVESVEVESVEVKSVEVKSVEASGTPAGAPRPAARGAKGSKS
jgi:large subunit ribosomal protein L30